MTMTRKQRQEREQRLAGIVKLMSEDHEDMIIDDDTGSDGYSYCFEWRVDGQCIDICYDCTDAYAWFTGEGGVPIDGPEQYQYLLEKTVARVAEAAKAAESDPTIKDKIRPH